MPRLNPSSARGRELLCTREAERKEAKPRPWSRPKRPRRSAVSGAALAARIRSRAGIWKGPLRPLRAIAAVLRSRGQDGTFPTAHLTTPWHGDIRVLAAAEAGPIRDAIRLLLTRGSVSGLDLVRFLAFDGCRRVVSRQRDRGEVVRQWLQRCDRPTDPGGPVAGHRDPWLDWGQGILVCQRKVLNAYSVADASELMTEGAET